MVILKQIVETFIFTLKKLLSKMGLVAKGKVTKLSDLTPEEIKELKMKKIEGAKVSTLTESEINFILAKLKSANYVGAEFEIFSSVWMKLVELKK